MPISGSSTAAVGRLAATGTAVHTSLRPFWTYRCNTVQQPNTRAEMTHRSDTNTDTNLHGSGLPGADGGGQVALIFLRLWIAADRRGQHAAYFKTVASPPERRWVGSTPIHLRHQILAQARQIPRSSPRVSERESVGVAATRHM